MAFTVVPLHNLKLTPGTRIPFANGLVFQDLPNWVREEKFLDEYLSFHERHSVLKDDHALVAEYEASAIGEPDRSWKGTPKKTIQESKSHWAMLANLAIWLRQPSKVCFTVTLHSLSWTIPGKEEKEQIIQQSETQLPIYCHPKDVGNVVTTDHLVKAAALHHVLCSIPDDNAVWVAMRALWAGLTSYSADIRYSLFWVALEALFGADDGGEISYKLAQRIAFFLAETPADARDLFSKAKKCYGIRSKIVHGRWKNEPDIDEGMARTEAILRTAFRHLIDSPELLRTFISKKRDKFLEEWVFSRATEPPPFPN